MKAIYKYNLGIPRPGDVDVRLPSGSQVLSCGIQGDNIVVWAVVDTEVTTRQLVRFRKVFTGSALERVPGQFLGTVQVPYEGYDSMVMQLVLHVFQTRVVETADGTIIEIV